MWIIVVIKYIWFIEKMKIGLWFIDYYIFGVGWFVWIKLVIKLNLKCSMIGLIWINWIKLKKIRFWIVFVGFSFDIFENIYI